MCSQNEFYGFEISTSMRAAKKWMPQKDGGSKTCSDFGRKLNVFSRTLPPATIFSSAKARAQVDLCKPELALLEG